MKYNLYLINDAGSIVLTIFFTIIVGVGAYFLFKIWNKERIRSRQEKVNYIENLKNRIDVENDILQYISRYGTSGAFTLLQIEIDGLRDVESAFGEQETKKLLIKTANKILDILPFGAELTRIKENVFLLFVKNESNQANAFELSNAIINVVKEPIIIMGHASIELAANIGIVLFPIHGTSYKELAKNLDLSTYISKKDGKNHVTIYNSTVNDNDLGNLEYYQQILEGIKNNQFCLYYQPIMNIKENKVVGLEGLLRWNHPTLGLISPHKFLNVIEQSGDIKYIGLWSFECLIKMHYEIVQKFPEAKILLHLNLSPKQLIDESLVVEFSRLLKKYKAAPEDYCLEIVEYAVYDKHPILNLNIKKLKEMGFKIATDNYGVDYGILNKIKQMPIDIIKLDRDFLIEDEENTSLNNQLVTLLMNLCKETNKKVVALGMEDEKMIMHINELGIELVQGYYYSAPVDHEKIINFIDQYNFSYLEEKQE